MWALVSAITTVGLGMVGLAVLVGKLRVEDALVRIGGLLLILVLVPCITPLMRAALTALLKPVLLLLLLVVVVTVFVRVLVSLL